jgi:hypothetical protein
MVEPAHRDALNGRGYWQATLQDLRCRLRDVDRDIAVAITGARSRGMSDEWIGGCLGVSATTVRNRWVGKRPAKRVLWDTHDRR